MNSIFSVDFMSLVGILLRSLIAAMLLFWAWKRSSSKVHRNVFRVIVVLPVLGTFLLGPMARSWALSSLSKEFQAQQVMAANVAGQVSAHLALEMNALAQIASDAGFTAADAAGQEEAMTHFLADHRKFVGLACFSAQGRVLARAGQMGEVLPPIPHEPTLMNLGDARSVGLLERIQGKYPAVELRAAIPGKAGNVLAATLDESWLSLALEHDFLASQGIYVAIAASDGSLIAYSTPADAFRTGARLKQSVLKEILTATAVNPAKRSQGLISSGAYAQVKGFDWFVYVEPNAKLVKAQKSVFVKLVFLVSILVLACYLLTILLILCWPRNPQSVPTGG